MNKILLYVMLLVTFSCNKILDIRPEDQIIDDQVFDSKLGIENTLNGLYLSMVNGTSLYGSSMTMTVIDILAQYYNMSQTENVFYQTALYNYNDNTFVSISNGLWNGAYNIIFQSNIFIEKLKTSTIIDTSERKILLGEAYGIRAYIMLDLLRLYGPIYRKDSSAISIPINHNITTIKEEKSPANTIVKSIIADLDTSISYLINDPIRTNGVVAANSVNEDVFMSMRNRRFNYYAALALLARVYMYQGNKISAYQTAKSFITETKSIFPFSSQSLSLPGIANPDRTFSSEVIFGILNPKLYDMQLNYFSSSLLATSILIPLDVNLNSIYESNPNDYRFRVDWLLDPTTAMTSKSFYKYADVTDKTSSFRYLQPLIRLSEIYYIAAECTDDITEAARFLNTVRNNRGLLNTNITVSNLRQEITKEYKKEFWGEGQLFFYYKRINLSSIPSGNVQNTNITMTDSKYVIPLPQSETNYQ